MGNSSTDNYFIQKPAVAAAQLRRGCSFYWIDFNINTLENRVYVQILSQIFLVYPFDKWEALASTINGLPNNPITKICVISSSSLPPEAYAWLQAEKKVEKMMLFCGSAERAAPIIAAYPKISSCSTILEDLIYKIRLAQIEDTHSMLFFSVPDMCRLNSWMHNWFALQQSVVRQRGKEHFKQLLMAINGSVDKRYDKEYILTKNGLERQVMVLEWIKANNFFFQLPSQMLTKVRDTFSLALVRQPLFDIYNSLKTSYASENYPEMPVYIKLCLNAHELGRLRAGIRYFYFSTFLICETSPVRKSADQNEFAITLKLKPKANNADFHEIGGFFYDQPSKTVLLNIDIPFQITQLDMEKREMIVEMVHVPRGDVEQPDISRLQLHRRFIRYIGKILPGQLLPSHHNGQLGAYYDQLKSEVDFLQQTTNVDVFRKCMRKLEMAKIKLYYHLEDEEAIQQDVMKVKDLAHKIQNEKDAVATKIKIYLFLLEIYMRLNNLINFARCSTRLKQIYDQSSADFSEEEANKQKLYSFYSAMASNKSQVREFLERVRQIEGLPSTKQREDARVSELSFLAATIKAKGEELLGNIPKAIAVFDELLEDIQTCQGQNQVYRYYVAQRDGVRDRQLNRVKQIEDEQIKKKIDSKVPLESLSREPLKIRFNIQERVFGGLDSLQLIK